MVPDGDAIGDRTIIVLDSEGRLVNSCEAEKASVVVADASWAFRHFLKTALTRDDCRVYEATCLISAWLIVRGVKPDLTILDLSLENGAAVALLPTLREMNVQTIAMSACVGVAHRMACLEAGADDYIARPVDPREVALRATRILARRKVETGPARVPGVPGQLDAIKGEPIELDGASAVLTRSEAMLLQLFLSAPNRWVSREEISQRVMGRPLAPKSRAVDILVSKLRQKLDRVAEGRAITSVRGLGYRLEERLS